MINIKAIACVLAAIVCGFLTIACAYMAYDAFAHMDFMFGPLFVAAAAGSACMVWLFSGIVHLDIYSTAYDEGWDDGWAQRDEQYSCLLKEAVSSREWVHPYLRRLKALDPPLMVQPPGADSPANPFYVGELCRRQRPIDPLVKLGQGDYERCDKDIIVPPIIEDDMND
tara:strand:- start:7920 stop:8426 length:507 start_codon:yes stop_codon:yes gene_type:complete